MVFIKIGQKSSCRIRNNIKDRIIDLSSHVMKNPAIFGGSAKA